MWCAEQARFVNRPERIGVLGGTFDPIHRSHLALAHAALRHAQLDRVLLMVAAAPPHKLGELRTSAEDRLELVECAVSEEPRIEACRPELDRSGPSYTVDTLRELRQQYPEAEFFLVLGQDAVADLPNWREPQRILDESHVLAVPRPSAGANAAPTLEDHCTWIDFEESSLSATEIRTRLAQDANVDDVVPAAVLRRIHEKGLYRGEK